jgi:hypothetical protein
MRIIRELDGLGWIGVDWGGLGWIGVDWGGVGWGGVEWGGGVEWSGVEWIEVMVELDLYLPG